MKISKNKFKLIFIILILGMIVSGVSVYATYNYLAKDVSYIKENGEELNLEEALNELYDRNFGDIEYQFFYSNVVQLSSAGKFYTKTISIPKGKRKVYIYSCASSDYGIGNITIQSNIIESQKTSKIKSIIIPNDLENCSALSVLETNGEGGEVTINYNCLRKRESICSSSSIL